MENETNLCECGCGKIVNPGRRFILGHHHKGKPGYFLGKKHSEETKNKLRGRSSWNKGKTGIYSEEYRNKISIGNLGKKYSEETRKKMSEAHKGKLNSEETRKKMSEAKKGKTFSEEHKKKMSEAQKLRWKEKKAAQNECNH